MYILILVVLNLGQVDLGTSECDNHRTTTQRHRLARLAGRVIEHALVSATIDVLIKCSPSFRVNGSDQEKM